MSCQEVETYPDFSCHFCVVLFPTLTCATDHRVMETIVGSPPVEHPHKESDVITCRPQIGLVLFFIIFYNFAKFDVNYIIPKSY